MLKQDPVTTSRYVEVLRQMTATDKLAVSRQLRETAWELVGAGVRMREPSLPESAVQERIRAVFLRVVD